MSQYTKGWRTEVSRSLLLCIVLIVCVACIPTAGPLARVWTTASQDGGQPFITQSLGITTGLAAGQPSVLLLNVSQAGLGWPQTIGPASGLIPSTEGISQLIGFDPGVLTDLKPQELLSLVTWLRRGVWFEGDWSAQGLQTALRGLQMTLKAMGGNLEVTLAVLGITGHDQLSYAVCASCFPTGNHFSQPGQHQVTFDSNPDLTSFLHETGHVVDYYLARDLKTNARWWSEVGFLGLGWKKQVHQSGEAGVYYLDTEHDAPHSEYSPKEDFADTFAAWVLEENHQPLPRGWRNPSYRRVLMLATVPGALLE